MVMAHMLMQAVHEALHAGSGLPDQAGKCC
jgi:hypothetical protein